MSTFLMKWKRWRAIIKGKHRNIFCLKGVYQIKHSLLRLFSWYLIWLYLGILLPYQQYQNSNKKKVLSFNWQSKTYIVTFFVILLAVIM